MKKVASNVPSQAENDEMWKMFLHAKGTTVTRKQLSILKSTVIQDKWQKEKDMTANIRGRSMPQ